MYNLINHEIKGVNIDLSNTYIDLIRIEKDQTITKTIDSLDSLYFITNGNGTIAINGKTYENLSRSSVFYVPKKNEVSIKSNGTEELEIYHLLIKSGKNNCEMFKNMGFSKTNYITTMTTRIGLVENLYKCVASPNAKDAYKALSMYYRILYILTEDFEKDKETSNSNEHVEKAKAYIHMQYHLDINVNKIADYLYLNRSYFSMIFKKETGMSPLDYLINFRIKQACQLLEMGKSVVDVAMLTGFSSSSNFSTHFKKVMNITPSEYRLQMMENDGGIYEKNN